MKLMKLEVMRLTRMYTMGAAVEMAYNSKGQKRRR